MRSKLTIFGLGVLVGWQAMAADKKPAAFEDLEQVGRMVSVSPEGEVKGLPACDSQLSMKILRETLADEGVRPRFINGVFSAMDWEFNKPGCGANVWAGGGMTHYIFRFERDPSTGDVGLMLHPD